MAVLVVLDTNVLVSAARSRRGASFRVVSLIGTGAFDVVVSVPLALEYEEVLLRQRSATNLSGDDVSAIVDYICLVGKRQPIFFLWRPKLTDPRDDMVAEVAIASGSDAIVTHNTSDFAEMVRWGVAVLTPAEFLSTLEGEGK